MFISLIGFLIHLFLIFLFNNGYLNYPVFNDFSGNYITAIYTPFSFLLIYEVFLFLIYLPKSFTKSIGKQYEIISIIVASTTKEGFLNSIGPIRNRFWNCPRRQVIVHIKVRHGSPLADTVWQSSSETIEKYKESFHIRPSSHC